MARVADDFWPEQGVTNEHTLRGSVTEEQPRKFSGLANPPQLASAQAISVFQRCPRAGFHGTRLARDRIMKLTAKIALILICISLCGAGTFIASTAREQNQPQKTNVTPVKNRDVLQHVWILT